MDGKGGDNADKRLSVAVRSLVRAAPLHESRIQSRPWLLGKRRRMPKGTTRARKNGTQSEAHPWQVTDPGHSRWSLENVGSHSPGTKGLLTEHENTLPGEAGSG